ncbi:bifunctional 3-(3-hydroxy-phenyl)propionate/3-hydroxycinnamic acid hydroxylase [Sphingobium sp.]|uniref:bifunctional 3-(3-hydroxy-phenyl)propionate/3-hydroxycinnamic acid hydroxylase MhpA n=1 Tax=Sphingobium sp. TaxID=1912891 RepID=UPI0028BF2193|nr:bifunctional 3-(3-hydroxy-phenyl)propionate/3-hydroxycinnamic acid hydroxylase [Sphingobium sp.]
MIDRDEQVYDVIVVGLGPVGAAAAQLLAREGLAVLAVEPALLPYDKPRAIGMDHEALRLLQKLGITDALGPHMGPYRPSEYRSGRGELLRRIIPQPEPYPLSWPPYCTFVQPELERLLRDGFSKWQSLEVLLGWRMTALEQEEAGVSVVIQAPESGEERRIGGRYLIGCDGAWSPVREAMGLKLEDLEFDEPWLVVDVRVNEAAVLPDATIQYCDPARPCTFVHGPGDLRRWEIMLLPGEEPADMLKDERIWSLLSRWLTPDQGEIWRAAAYRFHALVGSAWRKGRVFVAGDAAHQTPPFMAQGLNQGLRDVGNLCWKLADVLSGRAGIRLLDTYDEERRPNARAVIELTKSFGRLICERDPAAAAERDRKLLEEMRAGRGEIVRQDLLPPLFAGLLMKDGAGRPSPAAGTIFPQPWIETPLGLRRMDDVLAYRYLLVISPDCHPSADDMDLAASLGVTIARLERGMAKGPVAEIAEQGDLIAQWMKACGASAVLVRPDHVVFGSSDKRGGERELLKELERQLGLDSKRGEIMAAVADEPLASGIG